MTLKTPLVIDTSGYNYGSDWSKVPGLAAMYSKATEGYFTLDSWFPQTLQQAHALKIPFAAYHFYRESWYGLPRDPVKQANVFYNYVQKSGGLVKGDRIVLDAEDDKMTIGKVLACGREMRRLFGQWPWLYTGFYYIKDKMTGFDQLTEADIADLKQMGLILSFYPDDPDKFSDIPSYYIPDQKYFGPVVAWQWSEEGTFPGIVSTVDMNLFHESVLVEWVKGYDSEPVPEPKPTPEPIPDGEQTLQMFTTYNYLGKPVSYHVATADLSKYDIVVDAGINFMTTDKWCVKNKLNLAVNGLTAWYPELNKKHRRTGRTILDGPSVYHGTGTLKGNRGITLYMDANNKFSVDRPSILWNAQGVPNLLVKDGTIQPIDHAKTDIRARTAIGINKDQTRIFIVGVDGGDYWEQEGMNLQQTAHIMLDLGCDLAVMGDGGGSTTMIITDQYNQPYVVGTPSGEEPVVVGGKTFHMRPVAVHFGLRRKP